MVNEEPTVQPEPARKAVWLALSELFLDTEMTDPTIAWIARVLAASPFSDEEIVFMFNDIVAPVCGANLLAVAGAWSGFDRDWLVERCTRVHVTRPFYKGKMPLKRTSLPILSDLLDPGKLARPDFERVLQALAQQRLVDPTRENAADFNRLVFLFEPAQASSDGLDSAAGAGT